MKRLAPGPTGFDFAPGLYDARAEEIASKGGRSSRTEVTGISTEVVRTPLGSYILFRSAKLNAALYFKGARAVVDLYNSDGSAVGKGLRLSTIAAKYPRPFPDETPQEARDRWANDCALIARAVRALIS